MLFPHDISEDDYEYVRPCSSMAAILQGCDLPEMTSSPAYGARKEPTPADLLSPPSTQVKPLKPPAPLPVKVYKPPPPMPPTSGQLPRAVTVKRKQSVSRKELPPEPPLVETRTNGDSYDYVYNHKCGTATNRRLKEKEFETLHDVPADIRTLTQKQLTTCMRMLKISEIGVCSLAEQGVDGNILVSLDESILTDEFRFTRFDAIKLMRFAKEGYRPHAT